MNVVPELLSADDVLGYECRIRVRHQEQETVSNERSSSQIGKDHTVTVLVVNLPSPSADNERTREDIWLPTSIPSRSVPTSPDRIAVCFAGRPLSSCVFALYSFPSKSFADVPITDAGIDTLAFLEASQGLLGLFGASVLRRPGVRRI